MKILAVAILLAGVSAPPDDEWKEWFTEDDVTVEISHTGDSDHPWIRAHYEFPVAADVVESTLCDFSAYQKMFKPGVSKVGVLADNKDCTGRLHIVWDFPWPFRNRDGIVVYSVERPDDDTFVLNWQSGEKKGDPKQGVRIKQIYGATIVKSLGNGKSRVTYQYLGDLGGKFPQWLKDAAWKGEPPMYMSHLRQALGLGEVGQPWPDESKKEKE